MPQMDGNMPKKHMKAFWPLMIIFIVAAVFAGLIYWFEFNLITDYDLQSMSISAHRRDSVPKTNSKTPAKAQIPAPVSPTPSSSTEPSY